MNCKEKIIELIMMSPQVKAFPEITEEAISKLPEEEIVIFFNEVLNKEVKTQAILLDKLYIRRDKI